MNFEVIFLGTSAAVPSSSRGHASVAIRYFDETLLFDCGEGTQRQLIRSKNSYMRIKRIFITHYHGDHFLGLPGLFQTMSLGERTEALELYGPRGIEDVLDTLIRICRSDITFDIIPREIRPGTVYECNIFRVSAVKVDHSALTYGLVFEEVKGRTFLREKAIALGLQPGPIYGRLKAGETVEVDGRVITPDMVLGEQKECKKVVYTSDTRPCQRIAEVSKDAYLIHDSTYDHTLQDQAVEATHSTCVEAAEIARKAGARQLYLTHISPRYMDTSLLLDQARPVFRDTVVAKDFLRFRP
ncbi:MAG: ribonuclease Z [Methanobacteriota archaeon]|nr:MAG: ribonuclease Z [Euryarchaeota archaeon]